MRVQVSAADLNSTAFRRTDWWRLKLWPTIQALIVAVFGLFSQLAAWIGIEPEAVNAPFQFLWTCGKLRHTYT